MDDFRDLLQAFIRQFGLLAEAQTPCGQPLTTSHAHALMVLRPAGADGLAQAALVQCLGLDKSSVSRLIGRMVEAGHAAAAPAGPDGRAKPVRLTRKGAHLAEEVDRSSRARFDALLRHVAPGRRSHVVAALGDVVKALERMRDTAEGKPVS